MSEFSPFRAEMRDMELATTRSRRKTRRSLSAVTATTARSAGSFRLFKGRSFRQKIWGGTLYWGRALQSQGIEDSFEAKGD